MLNLKLIARNTETETDRHTDKDIANSFSWLNSRCFV